MAARVKAERKTTSSLLLQKLREGQEELRRSVRVLSQSVLDEKWEEGGGKEELAVHRYTGGRRRRGPLDCVDNLPRKRARLMQLSPTTSVSSVYGWGELAWDIFDRSQDQAPGFSVFMKWWL